MVSTGLVTVAALTLDKRDGIADESSSKCEEDVRQVSGVTPARSRHGDLREPTSQAAAGLEDGSYCWC